MQSRVHADTIRRQIRRIFEQYGATPEEEMCESMLIRDGYFCGRRFELDGFSAVWFVEENELKIYDAEGGLIEAESLALARHREAA